MLDRYCLKRNWSSTQWVDWRQCRVHPRAGILSVLPGSHYIEHEVLAPVLDAGGQDDRAAYRPTKNDQAYGKGARASCRKEIKQDIRTHY